jgi:hypothetical protein
MCAETRDGSLSAVEFRNAREGISNTQGS